MGYALKGLKTFFKQSFHTDEAISIMHQLVLSKEQMRTMKNNGIKGQSFSKH